MPSHIALVMVGTVENCGFRVACFAGLKPWFRQAQPGGSVHGSRFDKLNASFGLAN